MGIQGWNNHLSEVGIPAGRDFLAEREGFEPPIPVKVWPLSRRLVSTTHAPLRAVKIRGLKYFIR
jgi:hypothetical protein